MNIVAGILGFFLLAIIVLILALILMSDLQSAKTYKNARQCTGIVCRILENCQMNAYGSGAIGMRKRTYRQYEVTYQVNGNTYIGIVQTKEKHLAPGDTVVVHYVQNEDTNEPKIVTGMYADRLRELLIGVVFGVILAVGIIFLKSNGRI